MRGVAFLRFGQDSLDYLCLMRAITDPTKKKPKVTGAETSMFVFKQPHNESLYGIDYDARQDSRDVRGPYNDAKSTFKYALDNPQQGRRDNPSTKYNDKYWLLYDLLNRGFGDKLNPSTRAAGAIRGILNAINPDKSDVIDTSRIPLTKRHVQRLVVDDMPKPEIQRR